MRTKSRKENALEPVRPVFPGYDEILAGVVDLLETARRASARAVNSVMTATYWEIGRRIVHQEKGRRRAEYGEALMSRLSADLTARYGRGFSKRNLQQMRLFYLAWPIAQTVSAQSPAAGVVGRFPLPWSHYVKLLSVQDPEARRFYESEAMRGGWSVRQLERQISSKFYERTLCSRNRAAMLRKAAKPRMDEELSPEEEIKDPFVLEFLGLRDEYSESDLEEALVQHLEVFLLELGGDFAFVGRQRRLRVGDEWYRLDLLFFHRRLRSLVIIDLKLGRFTSADVGQMHLYLNYAREHWVLPGENPPVGLLLCARKDEAVAHYALEGLPNKVVASEYRMALPNEEVLIAELKRTQKLLETRKRSTLKGDSP
ncbi:MAG: PDDEXK nuclease domain-containing protein [Thermoguttaceae bacterium]|jgi:predicted nuclease of restriction endonuclease-like (RecB) superfamily|nr:PDDEXK nuclease domain-containing protein [Thermoguttaceae bacterium]